MRDPYEKDLEDAIHRELRALPDLAAPRGFAERVLASVEHRASRPWYRSAWQAWPAPLRVASLAVMALAFGALCFGAWRLTHAPVALSASEQVSGWMSEAAGIWRVLSAIGNAVVLVIRNLGTGFLVGCLAAIGLGYATCVGLGSACVKLALARRY